MSPAFYSWLDNALKGNGTTHSAQLVRADARPGYGLALSHATVAGVMLPRVDRAATAPVYLRVSLAAEQVRRVPATVAPSPSRTAPILASSLTVSVAGQRTGVTSVGPWTATIKQPADVGRAGEVGLRPRPADVGDLPLRLPELGKVGFDLDGWAQSVL